jgi:lipocalin
MKAKELIKWLELNPEAEVKIARASMDGDTEWCSLETEYEGFDEEDILVENNCFKLGRDAEANKIWW